MDTDHKWRLLLKNCDDENSRLIFIGSERRSLIDITIHSLSVDDVINAVVTSNWNAEQVIEFLTSESEKVLQEAH